MSIAQKEANETEYWIELLYETEYLNLEQFQRLKDNIVELLMLITASIKTDYID